MKQLSKDEKRQRLIDISIELFYKNGMSKTTIANITQSAGMGKSTFYEYFKSKEDVINQWFTSFCESFILFEEDINKKHTNKEKIVFMVKLACGSEYTNEKYISMFIEFWRLAFSQKEEESIYLIKSFYNTFSKQLQLYLEEGIKNREFISCDTSKTASAIMAQIDGLWLQYMLDQEKFDLSSYAEYAVETLLKGIEYD